MYNKDGEIPFGSFTSLSFFSYFVLYMYILILIILPVLVGSYTISNNLADLMGHYWKSIEGLKLLFQFSRCFILNRV